FIAFLHLSQALIAIRRTDDSHIAAASTLMVLLIATAAHDLFRDRLPLVRTVSREHLARIAGGLALGAGWYGVAVLGGFRIASFAAFIVLIAMCLLGAGAAQRGEHAWSSVGAMAAAALLLTTGLGARAVAQAGDDDALGQAEAIAAAMGDDIDACLTSSREAWIVPTPLTLYDTLDVTNPTPFYVFWYHFAGEIDRVGAMVELGEIPVIIQPYGWPDSMTEMVPFIEAYYELCAEELVPETGNLVRVWRHYAAE
ncbi:MAG TPA: hypothetical protein VML96_04935, partial [Egibacteraceae bacterium]|nr:hypothetical protein [Egibacteraceae bacterium]